MVVSGGVYCTVEIVLRPKASGTLAVRLKKFSYHSPSGKTPLTTSFDAGSSPVGGCSRVSPELGAEAFGVTSWVAAALRPTV